LSGNLAGGLRAFPNVTVYNPAHSTGYNITADNQALGQGANTRAITSSWTNQQFVLDKNKFEARANHLLANVYGQIDIIDGLSIKTYYGADYVSTRDFQMWDPRHGDGRGSLGIVFNQQRDVLLWNWQNTLNFNRDFGNHGIDFVAGVEYQKTTIESFNGQGTNFSDLFFMQHGLIGGNYVNQFSGGTYAQTAFESYFGRLNYSFKDKYLIGLTLRYDGISKFAPDKRFGTFPGISAGYRLSEEEFYKNSGLVNVVNEIKIRGSYAEVGNVEVPGGLFPYTSQYSSARYGSQNGVGFNQAGNSDLTWETSKKLDIGAEFGFLNNKITLIVDYFNNDIDDNVLTVPYPPSLGIPQNQIAQNIGKLKSTGLEFTLGATPLNKNGLRWDISGNFTTVKNEVVATVLNTAGAFNDIGRGSYSIDARVGESMNVILGYQWAGVNPANGYPMFVKGDGTIIQRNVTVANTYYVYNPNDPADISTTATLSSLPVWEGGDRRILGTTLPKWYGGLTNTLGYKGISLEVFMRFSGGNKVYNQTRQDFLLNQDFTNSGTELLNAWTPENTNTDIPRQYIGNGVQVNQTGEAVSRFVEKGDFLRIQNIALGYDLPKTMLDKIADSKIKSVKVYAQVQNAFTFTGYNGLDPELGVGFDNVTNPLNRTYTIGVNIGL
jgi:TonB-linked SusC/RagA family outer membrane protein